jgi:hypothetical protein
MLVFVGAGTRKERGGSSIARVAPSSTSPSSPFLSKLANRAPLGLDTQTVPALGARPLRALGTRAMLGAAIAAGEDVLSDTPILALLASLVFFVLRFSPRRAGSAA